MVSSRGWFRDSYRHSLASRGIRTSYAPMKYNFVRGQGISGWTPEEAKETSEDILKADKVLTDEELENMSVEQLEARQKELQGRKAELEEAKKGLLDVKKDVEKVGTEDIPKAFKGLSIAATGTAAAGTIVASDIISKAINPPEPVGVNLTPAVPDAPAYLKPYVSGQELVIPSNITDNEVRGMEQYIEASPTEPFRAWHFSSGNETLFREGVNNMISAENELKKVADLNLSEGISQQMGAFTHGWTKHRDVPDVVFRDLYEKYVDAGKMIGRNPVSRQIEAFGTPVITIK